jgi:hypothetical protein
LGDTTTGVAVTDTYPTMKTHEKGDRIYQLRDDLNFNMALVSAVVDP